MLLLIKAAIKADGKTPRNLRMNEVLGRWGREEKEREVTNNLTNVLKPIYFY